MFNVLFEEEMVWGGPFFGGVTVVDRVFSGYVKKQKRGMAK